MVHANNLPCTPWLFHIAMENGPSIDDFPMNTSIYEGFSMAMLNNQMVSSAYSKLSQCQVFHDSHVRNTCGGAYMVPKKWRT